MALLRRAEVIASSGCAAIRSEYHMQPPELLSLQPISGSAVAAVIQYSMSGVEDEGLPELFNAVQNTYALESYTGRVEVYLARNTSTDGFWVGIAESGPKPTSRVDELNRWIHLVAALWTSMTPGHLTPASSNPPQLVVVDELRQQMGNPQMVIELREGMLSARRIG